MVILPNCLCCGGGTACNAVGKPYQDTASTDPWLPTSGSWATSVTWSNPTRTGGDPEIFYFYGSVSTSNGGSVTAWDNPCNWWSVASTSPPNVQANPAFSLTHRATRLPGPSDVVHVFSSISGTGMAFATCYLWGQYATLSFVDGADMTCTVPAYDAHGCPTMSLGFDVWGTHWSNICLRNGRFFGHAKYNAVGIASAIFTTTEGLFGTARNCQVDADLELYETSRIEAIYCLNSAGRRAVVNGVTVCRNTSQIVRGAYCKGGIELFDSSTCDSGGSFVGRGPWVEHSFDISDTSSIGNGADISNMVGQSNAYGNAEVKGTAYVHGSTGGPCAFWGSSKYRSNASGVPAIAAAIGVRFEDTAGSNYYGVIGGSNKYCISPSGGPTGIYLATCNGTAPTYAVNPSTFGCG